MNKAPIQAQLGCSPGVAVTCVGLVLCLISIFTAPCTAGEAPTPDATADSPGMARLTIDVRGLDPREGVAAVLEVVGPKVRLVRDNDYEIQAGDTLCNAVRVRYGFDGCEGGIADALGNYNGVDPVRLQPGQKIEIPKLEPFFYRTEYRVDQLNDAYKKSVERLDSMSKREAPVPLRIRESVGGQVVQGAFQGFRLQTEPLEPSQAEQIYSKLSTYAYRTRRAPNSGAPDIRVVIAPPASSKSSVSAAQAMPLFGGLRRPSVDPPVTGIDESYLHLVEWIPSDYDPPTCVSGNSATSSPTLVFIDRPLASSGHPDLVPADAGATACKIASPLAGQSSPPAGQELTIMEFLANTDHGMHMVGVVEACANNWGLKGIAPGSPYELVPWEDDHDSNYIHQVRQERLFTNPFPVFVFASMLPSEAMNLGKVTETAGSYVNNFDSPERRYVQPALNGLDRSTAELWIVAAGQRKEGSSQSAEITQTAQMAPMNIGDNPAVIVVTACDPCTKRGAKIPIDAFRSVLVEPEGDADAIPLMVNVAAPGMAMWGLDRSQDGYSKADGPNTSHATAYVAGVVRGMLSCYWDHYGDGDQNINGDLKQRLMLTSWPGHLNPDSDIKGKSITVGIVDPEAAWLDPTLTWIRTTGQENGCFRPAGAVLLGHSCATVRTLNGPELREAYDGSDAEGWCAKEIPFSNGEPRDPANILRLAVWPGTKRYFSVSSIYPERRRDSAAQQWLGLRAGPLKPKRLGDEAPLLKISGKDVNAEPTSTLLRLSDVSDVILNSLKPKVSCQ